MTITWWPGLRTRILYCLVKWNSHEKWWLLRWINKQNTFHAVSPHAHPLWEGLSPPSSFIRQSNPPIHIINYEINNYKVYGEQNKTKRAYSSLTQLLSQAPWSITLGKCVLQHIFFIWSCSFQERQIYKHKWCSENSNKLCSHFLFVILQPPGLVQCLIGILHRVFCCNSKHGVSSGAQFSHHQAFVYVKCYVFHINKCLLIRKCVFHINKHLELKK